MEVYTVIMELLAPFSSLALESLHSGFYLLGERLNDPLTEKLKHLRGKTIDDDNWGFPTKSLPCQLFTL